MVAGGGSAAKSLCDETANLQNVDLRDAKDAQEKITLLSVMRRIFASGFRAGFVLSFRWIPPELNYSDKGCRLFDSGSRFFDSDYDPSKSLLFYTVMCYKSVQSRRKLNPSFPRHACKNPSEHLAQAKIPSTFSLVVQTA